MGRMPPLSFFTNLKNFVSEYESPLTSEHTQGHLCGIVQQAQWRDHLIRACTDACVYGSTGAAQQIPASSTRHAPADMRRRSSVIAENPMFLGSVGMSPVRRRAD